MRHIFLIIGFFLSANALADKEEKAQAALSANAVNAAYGMITQFTGAFYLPDNKGTWGFASGRFRSKSSDDLDRASIDYWDYLWSLVKKIYGDRIGSEAAHNLGLFLDWTILCSEEQFQSALMVRPQYQEPLKKISGEEFAELRRLGKISHLKRTTGALSGWSGIPLQFSLRAQYDELPWIENDAELQKFLDEGFAGIFSKKFASIGQTPDPEAMKQQAKDIAEVYREFIIIFLQSCKTKRNLQKIMDSPRFDAYLKELEHSENRQLAAKLHYQEADLALQVYRNNVKRTGNLVRFGAFVGIAAAVVAALNSNWDIATIAGYASLHAGWNGADLLHPNRVNIIESLLAKVNSLEDSSKPVVPDYYKLDVLSELDLDRFRDGFVKVAAKAEGISLLTKYGRCSVGELSAMVAAATEKFSSCGITMTADALMQAFGARGACSGQ